MNQTREPRPNIPLARSPSGLILPMEVNCSSADPQPLSSADIVNIEPIKKFVSQRLSAWPLLQQVILEEKEKISPVEYVARLPTWLTLLRLEGKQKSD